MSDLQPDKLTEPPGVTDRLWDLKPAFSDKSAIALSEAEGHPDAAAGGFASGCGVGVGAADGCPSMMMIWDFELELFSL
jgi:hypothetical protein